MTKSRLRGEPKTKRPLGSPEQVAIQSIQRTNDQMLNRFSQLFREYDLTPSQYNLLEILWSAGQPLSTQEIARQMGQGKSGMSGILGRLEKQGLIYTTTRHERSENHLCGTHEVGWGSAETPRRSRE